MKTLADITIALDGYTPQHLQRDGNLKVAAVAATMRQSGDGVDLLFIHRAEDPRDPWSGHMAFPGGRVEPGDADTLATAVRETREEVGLDLERAGRLLGRLSDVPAYGRGRPVPLVIEVFVFGVDGNFVLEANEEVAEIVWVPLDFLADRSHRSTVPWRSGGATLELPCYRYRNHVIWGLTFGMLDELLCVLDGDAGGGRWKDPRKK